MKVPAIFHMKNKIKLTTKKQNKKQGTNVKVAFSCSYFRYEKRFI